MQTVKNYQCGVKMILLFITTLTIFLIYPFYAQAFSLDNFWDEMEDYFLKESDFPQENNNTQVINEINVSANTGNKSADGGMGETGEAKVNVQVKNIINGKSMDPIEIESDANTVEVESKINVKGDNGKAVIERKIQIDSETSEENYEVDLGNEESDTEDSGKGENPEIESKKLMKENFGKTQDWWSNFVDNFVSYVQNIFRIF